MAVTDALCRSFLDLWWHFDPAAATLAGVPGHDGRLGAFDAGSVREHAAALRSIAAAVEDLEVEETADEIDRTALLDHLRVLLFRFEHEHPYERNPAVWLEHLITALGGLLSRPADDEDASASARERVAAIPGFLRATRKTLRQPPQFLLETGLAQLAALPALLEEVGERFAIATAVEPAAGAIADFRAALATITADPDPHAAAIGEDEVDRRLHYEHASIHNAAEVWRGTLRLAAEVENEVIAFAAAIDPQHPWQDLFRLLQEESVVWSQLSGELLEAVEAARDFAEARGLSAVAPPLEVAQLPAAAAVLEPVACYRPAGMAGRGTLLVAEVDRSVLPWLAVRLGVPGAHLQRAQSDALSGQVRRHITAASTPTGWGLYAQELMVELGFSAEPESRLMERVLFLREVHLAIVDLGLHTRQLTPAEAVEHLLARTPTSREVALADVRRLACRPTSAAAAILGRQELHRLRDDVRAAQGERFDLDDFHRALFGYGGLPIPLIRWGMGLDG